MANEATVHVNLQIRNGGWSYQSQPTAYLANVAATNGPTPGAVTVSTAGTDISLSQLTALGGLCWLYNRGASVGDTDPTHYVEYGVWDAVTLVFYPLGQLLPGEFAVIRLSPNLQKDEPGTGTGAGAGTTTFRFKAHNAACIVRVECFDP